MLNENQNRQPTDDEIAKTAARSPALRGLVIGSIEYGEMMVKIGLRAGRDESQKELEAIRHQRDLARIGERDELERTRVLVSNYDMLKEDLNESKGAVKSLTALIREAHRVFSNAPDGWAKTHTGRLLIDLAKIESELRNASEEDAQNPDDQNGTIL